MWNGHSHCACVCACACVSFYVCSAHPVTKDMDDRARAAAALGLAIRPARYRPPSLPPPLLLPPLSRTRPGPLLPTRVPARRPHSFAAKYYVRTAEGVEGMMGRAEADPIHGILSRLRLENITTTTTAYRQTWQQRQFNFAKLNLASIFLHVFFLLPSGVYRSPAS